MTALLYAAPAPTASSLCQALLEPILRTLQSAVNATGHGVQGQLLSLTYAVIQLGPVQAQLPELLVQTVGPAPAITAVTAVTVVTVVTVETDGGQS